MHVSQFSRKTLGIPYAVFLLLFVVAPLFVLVYFAFTNGQGQFTLANLLGFFSNPNTLGTLCYSFAIALVTTAVCLLLAYPVAYILATSKLKSRSVIIMLFVLPMWINFSLRITALKEILTLLEGNLAHYPFLNAVLGMTYDFLPFMILPIYNTITKLDGALLEAARDLGADEKNGILKDHSAALHARHCQRHFHGLSAGHDQLCGTGYALQQHLYHGQPDRQLLLRLQLARRLHDRADSAGHYLSVYPPLRRER